MPKTLMHGSFILRKTATNVRYLQVAGDVSKTVDFIQEINIAYRSQAIIIHTGTNNLHRESNETRERRFQRLEANVKHHGYTMVAISGITSTDAPVKKCERILPIP